MEWYKQEKWDEEAHQLFYAKYKTVDPEQQSMALITQAKILSNSHDNVVLKAAESLLLLWVSHHYDKKKVPEVYELIKDLCHKMGDLDRARHFESQLKILRPE